MVAQNENQVSLKEDDVQEQTLFDTQALYISVKPRAHSVGNASNFHLN
jgi:hypothetical protein